MPLDDRILGKGVYTPREAARLIASSPQQVLRWTRGSGPNTPLFSAHYQFLDDDVTEISFTDLIEVRAVAAMRRRGISLQAIRFAIEFAQERFGIDRPLASQSFATDGTEILMEAVERDGDYVSLSKKRPGQKAFRAIIDQSLSDLEYEDNRVARWRPKNFQEVVLDPGRYFGEPILDEFSLSTRIIYEEFQNFSDLRYLAGIYEVPQKTIQAAIAFESSLDEVNGKCPTRP